MSDTEDDDLDVLKEIKTYEDFVVYDKDESKMNKSQIGPNPNDNPFLKDWYILNSNPFKNPRNQSRFADLFKEILEKDRKVEEKSKLLFEEKQKKIHEELKKKIAEQLKKNNKFQKEDSKENFKEDEKEKEKKNEDSKEDEKENNFSQNTENVNTVNDNININDPLLSIFGERGISLCSNSSDGYTNAGGRTSTNDTTFYNYGSYCSAMENQQNEKHYYDLNLDIKKIISLDDKRTTLMIKNIPNKFSRDLLLNIINQNFRGTYDLFILPTDSNRYKNFGYAFINFTNSYFIPYFYFIFNGKMWSSTNSQKVCEITYSKIQGKSNLVSHYPFKIIFFNDEAQKVSKTQKYILPNEYRGLFNSLFPNVLVEKFPYFFTTSIPY